MNTNSLLNIDPNNPTIMDNYFLRLVEEIFEKSSEKANDLICQKEKKDKWAGHFKDGGYKCIHLQPIQFIERFQKLIEITKWNDNEIKSKKFLDIGCGVGQKMFLAKSLGFNAYGLELRNELIDEGKRLFFDLRLEPYNFIKGNALTNFIKGNALTYNDYSKFDILYFYCPLFDEKLEMEMEKRIIKQAKSGAIVIGFLTNKFRGKIKGWKTLYCEKDYDNHGTIYQKL